MEMNFSGFDAFAAVPRHALGLCPVAYKTESVASFLNRLDIWKADGEWVPASGGTETPFKTRSGRTLLTAGSRAPVTMRTWTLRRT